MHLNAQETVLQSGMRSSILPRLPTHLVQELNVGTVFSSFALWRAARDSYLGYVIQCRHLTPTLNAHAAKA